MSTTRPPDPAASADTLHNTDPHRQRLQRVGHVVMQVLWPGFLVAIIAEGIFFSMIDPRELQVVSACLNDSRVAAYTVAFFLFWTLLAGSSGITWFLARGLDERPSREG